MSEVYRFIAAEKAVHPVALLCRVLGVVRSSFHAWLEAEEARQARTRADDALAHEITVIHLALKGAYGVPRVHAELRRLGRAVNRKRVERVIRERGIAGVTRRRRQEIGTRIWPDRARARAEVFTFIETCYNRRRLRKHAAFGYITPHETHQRLQNDQALAA